MCFMKEEYSHGAPGLCGLEEEFTGRRFPFGCGVYFKPAPTKCSVDKACARACFGIFLGHPLSPGCRWNGAYLVGSLADFVDLDHSEDASAGEGGGGRSTNTPPRWCASLHRESRSR